MKRKALSLLLVLVMLLSLLPVSALADNTVIPSAAVTITPPAVGASPDYNPVLPAGVPYYSDDHSGDQYQNDVSWYDMTMSRQLTVSEDTFEVGHQYRMWMYLTANDGYTFSGATTATVNGQPAETRIYHGQLRIDYTFEMLGGQEINGLEINETNFPDPIFRAWVAGNCDQDGDGWLTNAERAAVKTISVSNSALESLQGVEYFPELETLDLTYNLDFTELDLSANIKLKTLDLTYNVNLRELDISMLSALESLYVGYCGLDYLDLSGNPALRELQCERNILSSLDLSANLLLEHMDCNENENLTVLNISMLPSLKHLNVSACGLDYLDLSGNPALEYLAVNGCGLDDLDLSANTKLKNLNLGFNNLRELDISMLPALEYLDVSNCGLDHLDLSGNPALRELRCGFNDLGTLYPNSCPDLVKLDCRGNEDLMLDISDCPALVQAYRAGGRVIDETADDPVILYGGSGYDDFALAVNSSTHVNDLKEWTLRVGYYFSDSGFQWGSAGQEFEGEKTLTAPEIEGYTFRGWYPVTEQDVHGPLAYGELLCDTPEYTFTVTDHCYLFLVAFYEKNESDYITVYVSNCFSSTSGMTMEHDTVGAVSAGLPFTVTAEEKEGYTFRGWYRGTEPDGYGFATAFDELLCETPEYRLSATEDLLLVALYSPKITVIKLYYAYSDTDMEWYCTGAVEAGTQLTETAPEKEGYRFIGWYRGIEPDENGHATAYDELLCETAEYSYTATGSVLYLVAVYEKNESAEELASGQCGDNLFWTLYQDGRLVITGTGDMWDFEGVATGRSAPWYDYRDSIQSAVLEPGAASIGQFAFFDCCNMTSLTIPEGVTRIGKEALFQCTALTGVALPETVTSIEMRAFFGCVHLTEITIPEGVVSLEENTFVYCSNLVSVTLPESMNVIGRGAFFACQALQSVSIPPNVTELSEGAFMGCTALSEIRFEGSAPTIESNSFATVYATAYYPGNDQTWTVDVRQDYGGSITWIPYGSEVEARIVVGSCRARLGDEIRIPVRIENNPGLVSIELNVHYDNALSWIGVEEGEFGGDFDAEVQYPVTWYAEDPAVDETKDGLFCTLIFQVKGNADEETARISVSYQEENIHNADEVNQLLQVTPGLVEIYFHLPGDINGDGAVNNKDAVRLQRYLKYHDVEVVEAALDVNGDGNINNKDATRLRRYLKHQDVEIY